MNKAVSGAMLLLICGFGVLARASETSINSGKPNGAGSREVLDPRVAEPSVIRVFLDKQVLTATLGDGRVFCTPVSTGKRPGWTPIGCYQIIGKSKNHRSSSYGKFVSKVGKTLKSNADARKDKKPPGASFRGAPMPNFLRLTPNGIGIHAGFLPGYPASKGCIRVSQRASEELFEHCRLGDKVCIYSKIEDAKAEGIQVCRAIELGIKAGQNEILGGCGIVP